MDDGVFGKLLGKVQTMAPGPLARPDISAADPSAIPSGGKNPAEFTPAVQKMFFTALRVGNRPLAACRVSGLRYSAYKHWMARGRVEATGFCRWFYDEVEKARGTAEVTFTGRIAKAGMQDKFWQANRYMLEQQFGWGDSGPSGRPLPDPNPVSPLAPSVNVNIWQNVEGATPDDVLGGLTIEEICEAALPLEEASPDAP